VVPFITDACFSGYGPLPDDTLKKDINLTGANNEAGIITANKTSGHAWRGKLNSVNCAYADGHVELNNYNKIQCIVDNSQNAQACWFYGSVAQFVGDFDWILDLVKFFG